VRLTIIAVGKIKADYATAGCAEFLKRLSRFYKVEHIEVRDVRRGRSNTIDECKNLEAESLLKHVPKGALKIALDEHGGQWSSRELAQWIDQKKTSGHSSLAFLLGGPDGHADSLLARANHRWSLGRLTLPHELARLMLLEQLYRAGSLLAGHPYHRD
jgi:23S rRNA (pseudouridine1915-N3)-methyltransferase